MAVPYILAGTSGGTTAQLDANWAYFANSIEVYGAWVRVKDPALGLEVYGAASSTSTLRLGQPGLVNWDIQNKATSGLLSFNVGGSDLFALQTNGLALLNDATARARITVGASDSGGCYASNNTAGTGTRYHLTVYESGVARGSITSNGSATAFNTTSDYRLKANPQPLTGSGAFIDALQPKTWEWITDGTVGVGFIAHQVAAVAPRSVVGEKDAVDETGAPSYQSMEYGSAEFIANIVAELQSLRARVAALEA
jgi:hypothetical protein